MKGISAIIATILLLLITIALAGTAYMYVSGMIGAKISKTISILSPQCSSNGNITIIISNDGTTDITPSEDLTWLVDTGTGREPATFTCSKSSIAPHQNALCASTVLYPGQTVQVTVISPSNSATQSVYCA